MCEKPSNHLLEVKLRLVGSGTPPKVSVPNEMLSSAFGVAVEGKKVVLPVVLL